MKAKKGLSFILIITILSTLFCLNVSAATTTASRVTNVKISYHFFNNQGTQTVIKWDKVAGASQYEVAIAKANAKRYFSHFSETNRITIHTELFENYKVQVRAKVNNKWGNYSFLRESSYFTALGEGLLNKPTLRLTNASNGISVKWNHCTCITENKKPIYRLYFGYSSKNWIAYKDISCKDTYLKKYGYYPIYSSTLNDGKWKDYYSGETTANTPSTLKSGKRYYFQVKMLIPTDHRGKKIQADKYSSVKNSLYLPIRTIRR